MSSSFLIKSIRFCDLIQKFNALTVFSDKINPILVFINLIELHNVLMIQVLKNLNLVFETNSFILCYFLLIDLLNDKNFTVWYFSAFVYCSIWTWSKWSFPNFIIFIELFYVLKLLNEVRWRCNDLFLLS